MTAAEQARPDRPWALWLVGTSTVFALVLVVVGALVSGFLSGGHVQYHSLLALLALGPSLVMARQRPRIGSASGVAIIGLTILAITQLVEALGAFGYGADGNTRVNGMVVLHDLGLGLSAIGLLAGGLGIAAGVGLRLSSGTARRLPALAATAAVGVAVTVIVLKLVGM